MQCRNWCFTLNNYDGLVDVDLEPCPQLKYYIFQEEVGENETPHLQGYLQFTRSQRFEFVTALLPGAHIEVQRGSNEQARDYCKKQDETYRAGPYEGGTFTPSQGTRTDIQEFKAAIDNGATDRELYDNYTGEYFKYQKLVAHCRSLTSTPRTTKTFVTVVLGGSGSGKSHYVYDQVPEAFRYDADSKYWNGFEGQKDVVFDDFRGSWFTYSKLLQILDRYPMRVYPMYGSVNFNPERIWITTTKKISEWYPNHREDLEQLLRRIDKIIFIKEDHTQLTLDKSLEEHQDLYV
jgi:hypothetical protein